MQANLDKNLSIWWQNSIVYAYIKQLAATGGKKVYSVQRFTIFWLRIFMSELAKQKIVIATE